MRKLIWGVLFLAACKSSSHEGTYANHTAGEYAIADDTLIVGKEVIINRSGFQKIRNGVLLPKAWQVKQWPVAGEDAPQMVFDGDKLILKNIVYTKIQ